MKTLFWREWHWNRVIVVAGVVIFLMPYTIATLLVLWPGNGPINAKDLAYVYTSAALFSYGISQLTIGCLGGNAMAGERADRTAAFLAYLPISRFKRLVSKLSLTAVVILFIWGLNWLAVWFLLDRVDSHRREELANLFPANYTAVTSLLIFGVAWLFSSLQSSPTIAICTGLLAPVAILLGLSMMAWANVVEGQEAQQRLFKEAYPIFAIVLGVLGFGAGTGYFLKRVEP